MNKWTHERRLHIFFLRFPAAWDSQFFLFIKFTKPNTVWYDFLNLTLLYIWYDEMSLSIFVSRWSTNFQLQNCPSSKLGASAQCAYASKPATMQNLIHCGIVFSSILLFSVGIIFSITICSGAWKIQPYNHGMAIGAGFNAMNMCMWAQKMTWYLSPHQIILCW